MKRKLSQRLQEYPTTNKNISLNNRDITLTIINHPDDLLEIFSREDSDGILYLPYWTYLWDSAVTLAHHISELGDLKNQRILEIGCGFGLVGIAAELYGAEVIFTDFEIEALFFALKNSQQNGIDSPKLIQMDWTTPCLDAKFDIILGSDVIYDQQNWQPIIRLFQDLLKCDGKALFSEPNRENASGFFDLIEENGLSYEKSTCSIDSIDNSIQINIYTIYNESD